jgi:hypothetical protein
MAEIERAHAQALGEPVYNEFKSALAVVIDRQERWRSHRDPAADAPVTGTRSRGRRALRRA